MKQFLVLFVLSAAGLAGVLYWRQSIRAPSEPVAATGGQPTAKAGKDRRQRKRRGARRLTRKEALVASATPSAESPPGEAPSPASAPPREDPAPVAPNAYAMTEVPPDDVFGAPSPSPSPSASVGRQPIDEPEPVKLRPADLKIVWQGADLSRGEAEPMRLDFSNEAGGRELSQDEIDSRFRAKEAAVLGCVERARPDQYTFVPGRVTVRFRILRTGTVKGVQVEAPVILHRGGLTGCIKGVVGSLRFPASNMSQVVSFPFSLM